MIKSKRRARSRKLQCFYRLLYLGKGVISTHQMNSVIFPNFLLHSCPGCPFVLSRMFKNVNNYQMAIREPNRHKYTTHNRKYILKSNTTISYFSNVKHYVIMPVFRSNSIYKYLPSVTNILSPSLRYSSYCRIALR